MAEPRTVEVVIPGAAENETSLDEVTVYPGSTAQDVLNALNRGTGYILGTSTSHKVFRPTDLVLSQLTDEDKFVLTPHADAGALAPASFTDALKRLITPIERQQAKVATPRKTRLVAAPRHPIIVTPPIQPGWQQKGWKQGSPGVYTGKFLGTYRGQVEFGPLGFKHIYIWDPPRAIWDNNHPKKICFTALGETQYELHMYHRPTSPETAILNMERIIEEAFSRGGKYGARSRYT